MNYLVNHDVREVELNLGELGLLKLGKRTIQTTMSNSLLQWFEGPFKVLENISSGASRFEVSKHMRAHQPIFYIRHLNPCRISPLAMIAYRL